MLFFVLWTIPGSAQGLFLDLRYGITPASVWGTIWNAGKWNPGQLRARQAPPY